MFYLVTLTNMLSFEEYTKQSKHDWTAHYESGMWEEHDMETINKYFANEYYKYCFPSIWTRIISYFS